MIIGRERSKVIENIKTAAESGDFYKKVEIDDPVLTKEQSDEIINRYLKNRKKFSFKMKSCAARAAADIAADYINSSTEIEGLEKVKGIDGGALITSNHFSPIENTAIRKLVKKLGKRRLNIVSQETNLAMPGVIGFLMNYADTIPISDNIHYLQKGFLSILDERLRKKEYVLIYPEQEMWFNYKKPRPGKRGAYYYAAKLGAPVISCFVEMTELPENDTEEFKKVKFTVHVLGVLRPDPEKSVKANSTELCKTDYELKKAAYEQAYNKKLVYDFENSDIAGWIKQ